MTLRVEAFVGGSVVAAAADVVVHDMHAFKILQSLDFQMA